ncbi:Rv0361 family membrane protein [Nocardia grenadensis]|uniref:Rv0361 family membrane protein n=1 Tax=Nocardia grenadensis TaxID=931537 RepID=UPI003D70A2AF
MTQPPAGPPPNEPRPPESARPTRKRRLIAGAVVAALVVVAALAAVVVLTLQGRTPLSSDDQQIEASLREFYGTLSDDGFAAATGLACKADRDDFDAMSDAEKSEAEKLGFTVDIDSVDNIVVTDDHAKAEIKGKFSLSAPGGGDDEQMDDRSEESLVKEDGEWRVCSSSDSTPQ